MPVPRDGSTKTGYHIGMTDYFPPVRDMMFVLEHVVGLKDIPEHPDLGKLDPEMVHSILEPAAKLASEVLSPLNWEGDQHGSKLDNGSVTTAPGFKDAYAEYRDGGWNAVPFDPQYGGQGLPWLVALAVQEMWQGANMSFGLCPLLNQGAIDAIAHHGSEDQKQYYLEKLIGGEWTGTMNLTEPQAGSDLSVVAAKAVPQEDGTYKIYGQKIYITYGEHDFTDNIIHLVLARTPDAPEGVKGISLFIVPKILEDGKRNDVMCTGIEHKLGIHASPTCTMQYGDQGGAIGYLVGQENEGLKYMFTMMNNARLSVGLQGVAIAERAYQHALNYSKDRVQGTSLTQKTERIAISEHPDVKRMLMTMKALTEAGRTLTYEAALAIDIQDQGKLDLLTPIVKSWCTDIAQDVTSLGVQIHGGMGFVEETGAAQYMRDARILPIYEGTNGIQAADLVFRKILRDKGEVVQAYFRELDSVCLDIQSMQSPDASVIYQALHDNLGSLTQATQWILETGSKNLDEVAGASSPYLKAFGIIAGGFMMARSYMAAQNLLDQGKEDEEFLRQKIKTICFYMDNIMPHASGHLHAAQSGSSILHDIEF